MEKRILKSMVDYVLEQYNLFLKEEITSEEFRERVWNYAKFLSMPLTLGMFIPVDEDGNVLEEPIIRQNTTDALNYSTRKVRYDEALQNVIFEGFQIEKREYDNEGWFQETVADIFIKEANYWRIYSNSKYIENLAKRNLTLTESAITKYQR